MEAFKPEWNKEHKYARAVPAGKDVFPIQSYATLEQLKEGYQNWQNFSSKRNITKPVPIEFLDKDGKCKVLTDLI